MFVEPMITGTMKVIEKLSSRVPHLLGAGRIFLQLLDPFLSKSASLGRSNVTCATSTVVGTTASMIMLAPVRSIAHGAATVPGYATCC